MSVAASQRRPCSPQLIDPPGYARHRPESTLLYQLVEQMALADSGAPVPRGVDQATPMHQNSAERPTPPRERGHVEGSVRYPRKIFFGGGLYLLVRPEGGRYWHYQYRYGSKRKTLSLGTSPDVPTALAQARHRAARSLLAAGTDPSLPRLRHRSQYRPKWPGVLVTSYCL